MPVVLRHERYRFFFYANEGDPREPVHVHVRAGGEEAKFWLRPEVSLAYNDGLDPRSLREATRLVVQHLGRLERAWNAFFA